MEKINHPALVHYAPNVIGDASGKAGLPTTAVRNSELFPTLTRLLLPSATPACSQAQSQLAKPLANNSPLLPPGKRCHAAVSSGQPPSFAMPARPATMLTAAASIPLPAIAAAAATDNQPAAVPSVSTSRGGPLLAYAQQRIKNQKKRGAKSQRILSPEALQWLEKLPLSKNALGKAQALDVARLFIQHEDQMRHYGITRSHLAGIYHIPITTISTMVALEKKNSLPLPALTPQAEKWLENNRMIPDEEQTLTIKEIARQYLLMSEEMAQLNITSAHLAKSYQIDHNSLKKGIYALNAHSAGRCRKLSEAALTWLEYTPPDRDENGEVKNADLARFFLNNTRTMKELKITIPALAEKYDTSPKALWSRIHEIRKASIPTSTRRELTDEVVNFLDKTSLPQDSEGNTPATEVAAFYINNREELKKQKITREALNIYFSLRVNQLNYHISKIESLSLKPGAAARIWLSGQRLKQSKNGRVLAKSVAEFYRQHYQQIKHFNITLTMLAAHFKVTYGALTYRIYTRQPPAEPTLAQQVTTAAKPDPDADEGVGPWYPLSLLFQKEFPLHMQPEDELIALGYKQGPLLEKLATVNIDTLNFTEFPAALHAYRGEARQRLQMLVQAAQNGTLNQLIKQEGNYALYRDEEQPELGWGVIATKDMPPGFILEPYPGFVYTTNEQYEKAAAEADCSFPLYAFEYHSTRPRKKADGKNKRPAKVKSAIGGHLRTGLSPHINTASVAASGKVLHSAANNVTPVKAGHHIVAFITTCEIKKGSVLLTDYGAKYCVKKHQPVSIKQEPMGSDSDSD
ncbi:SET domain-containing protein [Pantoea sp. B65]|uniref:SET domain-containing protein n=1 Tax=Pantoea sp. B65 TaxID=2813359 RepID=UPI0039B67824